MSCIFEKASTAKLDFVFNWTSWLSSSETLSTYALTVQSGLTLSSESFSSVIVTAWLSGGTIGMEYSVDCKIVTSSSRTDERSMRIIIPEKRYG